MSNHHSKRWRSEFALSLRAAEGTQTVEEAVIKRIERKLHYLNPRSIPVKLDMVASVCHIVPDFMSTQMKQDARLVPHDGNWHIQVNIDHNDAKRRFSIAHEISHKILAPDGYSQLWECTNIGISGEKAEEEELCDLGARIILCLMPVSLAPILYENSFCLETVQSVKNKFGVSFEAAICSLVDVTIEEVAAVFCAMRLKKAEYAKRYQLPLMPDYVTIPDPQLRILRSYHSRRFSTHLPKNKSVPQESCIFQSYCKGIRIKAVEVLTFKNGEMYQYNVDAIARDIYVNGNLEKGVVFLLSNPVEVN